VGRVEYWNDPAAPKPNSLVPACGILAVDDHSGRYAALPCTRRAPNAHGDQDNPVILTISPGWLEVMVVLSP
jgi:hypothetical protein